MKKAVKAYCVYPFCNSCKQGDRLLVLRGEGGRNLVRDTFNDSRRACDYIELYRRQLACGRPPAYGNK
jgi:uroporphyrinogen-III synthase